MLRRIWWRLWDALQIKYQTYRKTWWWLMFWVIIGVICGIFSITMGNISADDINQSLIDRNILNMAAASAYLGGFIWQRLLVFILPMLFLFFCALISNFTALVIYPLVIVHGYWLMMSWWWTWQYYNLHAIFLLMFYGIWLILVTAILLIALIWTLQFARALREKQPRNWRGIFIIIGVGIVMGIIEYFVFWLILGRIVYKPI